MNGLEENELIKRANKILEATGQEKELYQNERKVIFDLIDKKENLENLEEIINMFARIIKLEKEKQQYQKIISPIQEIPKQQVRIQDNQGKDKNRVNLFLIQDKKGNSYTFWNRENLKKYRKDHKIFDSSTEIKVIKNNNMDLEELIKKVKQI